MMLRPLFHSAGLALAFCMIPAASACAQATPSSAPAPVPTVVPSTIPGATSTPYRIISPLVQPTLSPGVVMLLDLEARFAESVAQGGGKAFASWFAEDAVTLNNGKPAVMGRGAIAANATWDAKTYTLTWVAQGAQIGPSNDMGFTWGHYEGRTVNPDGAPVVTSGRYMTVWRKLADGTWKVALDASADEPPEAGSCCTVPKP